MKLNEIKRGWNLWDLEETRPESRTNHQSLISFPQNHSNNQKITIERPWNLKRRNQMKLNEIKRGWNLWDLEETRPESRTNHQSLISFQQNNSNNKRITIDVVKPSRKKLNEN